MSCGTAPSVALRAAAPDDLAALQSFVRGLSIATRVRRFFAPMFELPPLLARAITEGDPQHRFLVAELPAGEQPAVVALGQLALASHRRSAELALVVADPWQGCGLGTRLLQRLCDEARRLGVPQLEAETQRDNRAMLALLRSGGFAIGRHADDPGLLHAALALPPAQVRERAAKKYFCCSAGVIAKIVAAKVAAKQL